MVILESFWATDEALRASERAVAPGRGEAALLGGGTVTVERYRLPVFEQDVPGRGGEGVRLTRMDAEPAVVDDVIEVFGDTFVPWLAETAGFHSALLCADPASGRLIGQDIWHDPPTLEASAAAAAAARAAVARQRALRDPRRAGVRPGVQLRAQASVLSRPPRTAVYPDGGYDQPAMARGCIAEGSPQHHRRLRRGEASMTTVTTPQRQQPIRSTIPARLDRLRWSPFHTRLVLGLGTAWVLDGLSITIASSVSSKLTQPNTLNLTTTQAASIGTVYLVGEVIGALVFGRLSDQLGRRSLFMWTLAIYLVGTALTALTPKGTGWIYYLYATRLIAGMGIGGEYSAINSAIDEMMPARYRGRTDIWINGTYWLGAILGTFASFLLLNSLPTRDGWRVAFLCGPALAVVIIFVRRNLPESPRWLITHGRAQEAEEQMRRIEEIAARDGQHLDPVPEKRRHHRSSRSGASVT